MPTLMLTPRFTEDSQALWRAASQLGWGVQRLNGWHVTEDMLLMEEPVFYFESLFGNHIAEQFGLKLITPSLDWLPQLPAEYRQREISMMPLSAARQLTESAFIKPPNDKSFPAKVYLGNELPFGYPDESPVLVAEIVSWEVEFRCFILNRHVQTISVYLRNGELQRDQQYTATDREIEAAEAYVQQVMSDPRVDFPKAGVLDVGIISGRGWAVVEQNAAWGSGLYGCDPVKVLHVLRQSVIEMS